MTDAFVLINVAMGHEADVLAALRDIEGVSMVHGTFGAYDVITKVESDDTTDMRSTITEKIRKIEHVRSTLALIIIDEQEDE
jgi:DNA-binding Lrp family transcriptional regulator